MDPLEMTEAEHRVEATEQLLAEMGAGIKGQWWDRPYAQLGDLNPTEALAAGDETAVRALIDEWYAATERAAEKRRNDPEAMAELDALVAEVLARRTPTRSRVLSTLEGNGNSPPGRTDTPSWQPDGIAARQGAARSSSGMDPSKMTEAEHRVEATEQLLAEMGAGIRGQWWDRTYAQLGGLNPTEALAAGDEAAVRALIDEWYAGTERAAEKRRNDPEAMAELDALVAEVLARRRTA